MDGPRPRRSSNGEVKRLVAAGEPAFRLTDTDDAHAALTNVIPANVVYPDENGRGTLVMLTSVMLMAGAPHPAAGRPIVDCLGRRPQAPAPGSGGPRRRLSPRRPRHGGR